MLSGKQQRCPVHDSNWYVQKSKINSNWFVCKKFVEVWLGLSLPGHKTSYNILQYSVRSVFWPVDGDNPTIFITKVVVSYNLLAHIHYVRSYHTVITMHCLYTSWYCAMILVWHAASSHCYTIEKMAPVIEFQLSCSPGTSQYCLCW